VLVDPGRIEGDRAMLDDGDGRHLTRALRRREGAPVSVADGAGRAWQGVIADVGPPVVVSLETPVDVVARRPELVVVHALPEGRKLDDVVRRLSELGVDRLQPVISVRAENRPAGDKVAKQLARWQAVAHAAAKQARRAWPLTVEELATWPGRLGELSAGAVLGPQASRPLGEAVGDVASAHAVGLGVGPEGGLTQQEVGAAGLAPAALGDTVLRTETAALAAAAVVLHRAGRFG
jgi:16S rRNA (uracil1498-N3)-methyltransferase